jgi:hypothetical protein
MQNNIRTVYISEIHLLYNLSTIFGVLYQNMKIIKIKFIILQQHWRQRAPAFSVDQLLVLHVKSMFTKYMRGVAICMYF